MNKALILVVEDDRPIRNLIVTTLKTHDYKYITAENGSSAILEASSHKPEIILLDLGLPDMEGVDVIKKVRTWSNVPIIVISARSEDVDKIEALDAGADDYITKPFSVDELLARIFALYRRANKIHSFDYAYGDVEYLIDSHTIRHGDQAVQLTNREAQLFELLLRSSGQLVTHDEIIEAIWGLNSNVGNGNILNYVYFLRNRLKTINSRLVIKGVYGSGYTLVDEREKTKV